jgi:acetate kinase
MPLQKYGFHGLSYASIVDSVAKYLKKPADQVDIVVAHLGSGASAACIQGGKSIDTSKLTSPYLKSIELMAGMGLTPLEGLIGGTRCGTIDPTAVFHLLKDPGSDGGADGMKVSKAEMTLNKYVSLCSLELMLENPVFKRWQERQTLVSSPLA